MNRKIHLVKPNTFEGLDSSSVRHLLLHQSRIMGVLKSRGAHRVNDADKIRMIRWLSWSRQQGVPLETVIALVWEWAEAVVGKKPRKRISVFPLSVAAMTGDACKKYVIEKCVELYSDTRPVSSALRSKMLEDVTELPGVSRGKLLSFKSSSQYVEDYAEHARQRRRAMASAEVKLSTSKPFRGNPFR